MPPRIETVLPAIERTQPLGKTRAVQLNELLARRERDARTTLHLVATGEPDRPFAWYPEPAMGRPPGKGEASGAVIGSVVTFGTARSIEDGNNPKHHGTFDHDLVLFRPGLKPNGEPGSEEWYPNGFGYGELVLVDQVGPQNGRPSRVREGQLASATAQVRERFTDSDEKFFAVNPDLYPETAAMVKHFFPIALNTILHAVDHVSRDKNMTLDQMKATLSRQRIVVNGGGLFGLLAAKFAQQLGAEHVVLVEPDDARRQMAENIGLTTANPIGYESDEAFLIDLKTNHFPKREDEPRASKGAGADFVIEFSGNDRGLTNSIRMLRKQGMVWEGGMLPNDIRLQGMSNEFHHFSQGTASAQIGMTPEFQPGWNRDALSEVGQILALSKDVARSDGATLQDTFREFLLTHVIPKSDAEATYHDTLHNNYAELKKYARHKDVQTTGIVFYYEDTAGEFFLDILPEEAKSKYMVDIEHPNFLAGATVFPETGEPMRIAGS